MIKFNSKQIFKSLIFLIIFVLVVILIDWPLYKKVKNFHRDLSEQKIFYSVSGDSKNSLQNTQKAYLELNQQIPEINQRFNKGGNELALITELENLAARHGLSQTIEINSAAADFNGQIQTLGMNLNVTGRYENFLQYLEDLEQMKLAIQVNGLDLNSLGEMLSANLSTVTYWYK